MTKIENIWVHPIQNNTYRSVVKVAFVDTTFVAINKDGKLYGNCKNAYSMQANRYWYYTPKSALMCLVKLKVITKGQMDEHILTAEMQRLESEKGYELDRLKKMANTYGFNLTKKQLTIMGDVES